MGHLLGAPILARRQVRVAGQALMSSGAGWVVSQYSGGGWARPGGYSCLTHPSRAPEQHPDPALGISGARLGGRGSPQVSREAEASASLNSRWVGQGFPGAPTRVGGAEWKGERRRIGDASYCPSPEPQWGDRWWDPGSLLSPGRWEAGTLTGKEERARARVRGAGLGGATLTTVTWDFLGRACLMSLCAALPWGPAGSPTCELG